MKVLLTGACGYTGSVLTQKLKAAGHEVTGWDTQWFGDHIGLNQPPKNIREPFELPKGTDAIIHLAAIANDPSVAYYPRLSWETGVLATMRLCEAAIKAGCQRFIYASSVSVYGADRGEVTEDMDLHPLSDYNKTKMAAERVLMSYHQPPSNGLNVAIVRPATVCGLSPRMRTDLTVNMFCMQALTKGVITVHGGEQYRPSIHIDDLTDLYMFLLDNPYVIGVYNAGFENLSLMEIAEKVRDNIPSRIEVTEHRDVRSYRVNSDKLLATGFKPTKTTNDAIFELWDAFGKGDLLPNPEWNNLGWMKFLGVPDE